MPYINRTDRVPYQSIITELAALIPHDPTRRPGHINYVVSLLLNKVYGDAPRYSEHNEVVGVLECIKQEFYRRNTAPYEDIKIAEQGDLKDL